MNTSDSIRRRVLLQAAGATALLAGCGRSAQPTAPAGLHVFEGLAMGSTYSIRIHAPGAAAERLAAARAAVDAAIGGVVAKMSLYDPASELSRFNAHASTAPFAVSADTFRVFELAHSVSAASHGAFDVSVEPAVEAWGFGPQRRRYVPADDVRRAARSRVGWRRLRLDPRTRTVVKTSPDAAADFSGIAKGHAAELAARALDALGFDRYVVETGGEVRTRGRKAANASWQVAIEQPDAMPRRARLVVPLADLALATSGDYRIFFVQNGRRYSHEIDPATGAPVRHTLASVSVAMPDCALADAWATALIVLGPERGPALAESLGLAAHFIVRGPAGFEDRSTPAFAALGPQLLV